MRTHAPIRRAAAALAGLAALLAFTTWAPAADARPGPRPLFWGAQIGKQLTGTQPPWDMNAAARFEAKAGKGMSLLAFYSPFADCSRSGCEPYGFPAQPMSAIRANGSIPFLSWSSSSSGTDSVRQPRFRLARIIDGSHDGYIRSFAAAAREWGHPFFLRFNWEMNGFWFPWNESVNGNSPGEFARAWRHVHRIFSAVGANNATWVWCPNIALVKRLQRLRPLYPGDQYVDWTCLDGFNWGDTHYSAGWMSFEEVFRSTYAQVLEIAPRKPMVIGETASEERGGSKASWIRNALRVIPSHFRKVRALVWFDEKAQGMDWPIESSRAATRAFARQIRRRVYRPNEFGQLTGSPISPPRWASPRPSASSRP